jgi:anti-anti-sigma factor
MKQVSSALMDVSLRRTMIGDVHVLVVDGSIDIATVPQLSDALSRLVTDTRGQTCAVDIDGARVFDDTALGVLLGAAGRARSTGGDLIVVCTIEKLRLRLNETRFDQAVLVRSTIADV